MLERLNASGSKTPVIVLTASVDVKRAVRATQLGAYDYLTKPIDIDEVVLVFKRALEAVELRNEVERLRWEVSGGVLAAQMGPSDQVAQVVEQVRTVAPSDFTVLVLGETGTGKELVAAAVHRESVREGKPFIAIDCGAIPETLLESELFGHEKGAFSGADRRKEGRFQLAEGGTLFLDEIGNLPMALQSKLLRVIESKQVQAVGAARSSPMDVRFIAATNHDLERRVQEGGFRADLYFRLAQYTIKLPALRERPSDIPYLGRRFLRECAVELRRPIEDFEPVAVAALERHRWPGNVRELRNVVRQAVLAETTIHIRAALVRRLLGAEPASEQPVTPPPAGDGGGDRSLKQIAEDAARDAERAAIREALRASHGNKTQAARLLRTDFKTLHVKMKQLGIDAHERH